MCRVLIAAWPRIPRIAKRERATLATGQMIDPQRRGFL